MTGRARRRRHDRVIHRRRLPARRPVATVARRRHVRAPFMVCRYPGRRFAVTRGTGPRRHIRMIERCRHPRSRGVTGVTSSRCQPAFMTSWNPSGN